jgi:hypothetical protein
MTIACQFSLASLLGVSAGNCHRALVNIAGMIRTQMGMHNRTEIATVHWMPCAVPPCNRTSNKEYKEK